MPNKYEQNLRIYESDIRLLAGLKAQGIAPATLKRTDPQAATDLSNLIGDLEAAGVMRAVETLAEKMRRESKKPPQIPKPKSKPPVQAHYRQDNFLNLLGLGINPELTADTHAQLFDPERKIGKLHDKNYRRKLQQREVSRAFNAWIKFLQDVGARKTPAERRAIILRSAGIQIAFLRNIGVWDMIVHDGVTPQIIEIIRKKMDESRLFHADSHSSEAVTVFGSPVAQAFKQILDQWDV